MKFWKRKTKRLVAEKKTVEELRASIEEKLANYDPTNDDSQATFKTLPLPTCPATTERNIRARIVVEDPEGDRVHGNPSDFHRHGATDQIGDVEDMSNLIVVPEGGFEVDWLEVSEDGVQSVRESTEHFWTQEKDNWGSAK